MNAYELADELDNISYDCTIEEWRESPIGNAAHMLRQQADHIAELEGELSRYELRDLEHTSRIAELEKSFVNQRTQAFANSLLEGTKVYAMQQVRIAELEKEVKELHKIAQVMAMQESDARKELQNYKDGVK
jgi:hypothetical protein